MLIRNPRRRGITQIEVLVIIGIIALLISIILPVLNRMKERNRRPRCASNLRQIGQGLLLYANDNNGAYPRTYYVPNAPHCAFTGAAAQDPFKPGGPAPNDVTAVMFMLVRHADLNPSVFVCDGGGDWMTDTLGGGPALNRSNFSAPRNVSYSIAIHYPDDEATKVGYKFNSSLLADFAVMADVNPGMANGQDIYKNLSPNAPSAELRVMNSRNHDREGQNVMFNDGHIEWFSTPFCGSNLDHIYTAQGKTGGNPMTHQPAAALDTVLVPTE